MRLVRLLFRVGFGAFGLFLILFAAFSLLFQARVFRFQRLKLRRELTHLPLQFLNTHAVSFAARGGKFHGYGVAAVCKFHSGQPVYGRLRRSQKGHMPQAHPVRHQTHAHMPVAPPGHQVPHFVRHLGKAGVQPAALAFQPVHPAEGRSPVALRMPETERRVPFLRIVTPRYGVQVSRRKRLFAPGAVRKRPRAGYLDPFVVHEKKPLFPSL